LLTLARNKPLLQKDIGIKDMLFEAYEKGTMIAVIPFTCKLLETCANSKVFKPPNPWVMAILRVLSEIYRKPKLRLNLKFDIELLCKALGLDINDIKPSDSLKDRQQYVGPNNFDFNPPPTPQDVMPVKEKEPMQVPDRSTPGINAMHPDNMMPHTPSDTYMLEQLLNFIHISPSATLFNQQPLLKRFVPMAVDRAIREIISPVVERSVTIACITTKELIMKDFATEPDEQKMRKAAHLMVQNLAGSLALVTCKEPLRLSMSNHLRSLLTQNTPGLY
jgi:CCR4-NOT transcription complex subunit 1